MVQNNFQNAGINFVAQNITQYINQINQANTTTLNFNQTLIQIQNSAQNTQRQLSQLSQTAKIIGGVFGDVAKRASQFGLALAGLGVGFGLKEAATFETSLAKIDALTGATTEEVANLREHILDLAETLPQSPNELGAAAYFTFSNAALDAANSIAVLDVSAKGASAQLGRAEDIAKVVAGTIAAYGAENISAAQAGDILTKAIQLGSAEASEFSTSLGRVIPFAAAAGVGFDEVTAALAVLTNGSLGTYEAVTGLLGIFNQLQSPSKVAEDALAAVGVSIDDISAAIDEKGLIGALRDLFTRFKDLPRVLGALFPEVRGFSAALSLFSSQGESASDILDQIRNSGGELDRTVERMNQTFESQVKILRNQFSIAAIEVANVVLPQLNTQVRELTRWIRANRQEIGEFIASTLTTFINVLKNVIKGVETLVEAFLLIPSNQARIIAAIFAIGGAMVSAFGPTSAAFLALSGIVYLIGRIANADSEISIGKLTARREEVRARITELEEEEFKSRARTLGEQAPGLFPNIPGLGALQREIIEGINSLTGGSVAARELENARRELSEINSKLGEAYRQRGAAAPTGIPPFAIDLPNFERALGPLGPELDTGTEAADKFKRALEAALKDGVITLTEALELDFTPTMAAAAEVEHFLALRTIEQNEAAYDLIKTMDGLTLVAQDSEEAFNDFLGSIAKRAYDLQQDAISGIFSRPTREEATLNLELAKVEDTIANIEAANRPLVRAAEQLTQQLNEDIQNLGENLRRSQEDLRDRSNAELKNIRNQRENEQEALRERQEDQLSAIRDRREIELDALRDTRDAQLDVIEEVRDAELDALRDAHNAEMDALRERQDAELAALRKNADQQIEGLRRQAARFTPVGEGTLQAQAAITQNALEARIREVETQADEAIEARRKSQEKEVDSLRKRQEDELEARRKAVELELDAARRRTEDELKAARRRVDDEVEALRDRQQDELKAFQNRTNAEVEAFQERIDRESKALESATEAQIEAKEAEIKAIETNVKNLTEPYEILAEQLRDQAEKLERQNKLQQLELELADQTLISEDEQNKAVIAVKDNMVFLSGVVADTSRKLNESLIPDFDKAAGAARNVAEALINIGSIPGRATGGSVLAGQPYWVGEEGVPELFVPRQSGMIYPSMMAARNPTRGASSIYNDNHMDISSLSLPNVFNAQQLVDQLDRKQSRRIHLSERGVIL